jgi:hypothetical protein
MEYQPELLAKKCRVLKQSYHQTVKYLEKHEEPPVAGAKAVVKEAMALRLKSAEGKKIQKTERDSGTGIQDNKTDDGVPAISVEGLEKVNPDGRSCAPDITCSGYIGSPMDERGAEGKAGGIFRLMGQYRVPI